jgi:hypothetical protein
MERYKLKNQELHPSFFPTGSSAYWTKGLYEITRPNVSWYSQLHHENEFYQAIGKSLTDFKVKPSTPVPNDYKIRVDDELICRLPVQLYEIKKSIDEAYFMLNLEEDWDDEGGMPVDKFTFVRAIKFLINYSTFLMENYRIFLTPPQLHPGPKGSVDISWRTQKYRMLINIPSDPAKQAGYYGDDKNDGDSIKGKIPVEGVKESLASWLKNLKA